MYIKLPTYYNVMIAQYWNYIIFGPMLYYLRSTFPGDHNAYFLYRRLWGAPLVTFRNARRLMFQAQEITWCFITTLTNTWRPLEVTRNQFQIFVATLASAHTSRPTIRTHHSRDTHNTTSSRQLTSCE
jgi:hypothetical protein